MPGADFSRVNNLKPVTERPERPERSEKNNRHIRELSPSLTSNATMYQSLRSYVGMLKYERNLLFYGSEHRRLLDNFLPGLFNNILS